MKTDQLVDSFGRKHDYLRISLTDACNLRCMYCMPNEKVDVTPASKMMQLHEIETLAKTFVELGIKKIRLTGGEPLVRKDAKEIIECLAQLPVELTLSTNAVLIDEYITVLKNAKVKNINVSLDTLNADDFFAITKRGDFKKIMQNIYLLLANNFIVKVNMVVMKGINDHAIFDFINWTKDYTLEVRFIEFMPFSGNEWDKVKVISSAELLEKITANYTTQKLVDEKNDTTKKYKIENHKGTFGFISTISEPFCEGCNRLRLTADGKMKNCLFSKTETDLLSALRKGEDLIPLILNNVFDKKKERGGQFDTIISSEKITNRSMIKIGG